MLLMLYIPLIDLEKIFASLFCIATICKWQLSFTVWSNHNSN